MPRGFCNETSICSPSEKENPLDIMLLRVWCSLVCLTSSVKLDADRGGGVNASHDWKECITETMNDIA